ncbi:methylecgonone reductase-like [Pyrus ussuriensis x Pyrus communis]|uniref:Methylecgonone reductase-like n=1 Tax=Pyrus ussuriensis x Pyrus communis TaxID=2448454 RepID=A0A5N5G2I4_9ROSA|nr:methylecgonone reductase-like [Pyrus ussuriensis x Pyrus communis]
MEETIINSSTKKLVPEVVLNSGHKMPVLGLGTGKVPPTPTDELVPILVDAIDAGYHHIDTAAFYQTEEAVGLAVVRAKERGLIKNRDDMFITSKLWCTDAYPDGVLPALKTSLRRLGWSTWIRWPLRLKHGIPGFELTKEDMIPFDITRIWAAMEEISRLGLAKSIGVSNFGTLKLSQILHNATIPPAVNQVEMNPSWQQGKLRDFCKERNSCDCVDLAAAKGKIVPQIILRSIVQQRASAVPKTFNKERMKPNFDIIKRIPQRRLCSAESFVSEAGPYKSLDQLWDNDP